MTEQKTEADARIAELEAKLAQAQAERSTVVEGWENIARVLRCSVDTAQRYRKRDVDPLPVRWNHLGRAWAWMSALRDWVYRNDRPYPAAQHDPRHSMPEV